MDCNSISCLSNINNYKKEIVLTFIACAALGALVIGTLAILANTTALLSGVGVISQIGLPGGIALSAVGFIVLFAIGSYCAYKKCRAQNDHAVVVEQRTSEDYTKPRKFSLHHEGARRKGKSHVRRSRNPKKDSLRFLHKEVARVNKKIEEIQGHSLQMDISKFVLSIRANVVDLIKGLEDQEMREAIISNALAEIRCVASQVDDIASFSKEPINLGPQSKGSVDWLQRMLASLLDPASLEGAFQKLLKEGKERGFLNKKFQTFFGGTLFHHLAKQSQYQEHLVLLMEMDIDLAARDFWGNTGLMWAIANAHNSVAMKIIKCSELEASHFNVCCEIHTNTALHLAVGKGYQNRSASGQHLEFSNLELVEALIAKGADVNLPNKDGNTPLHLAYARRDAAMIDALRKAGAAEIANKKGQLPEELGEIGYEAAHELLHSTVSVFVLDRRKYEASGY